VKLLGLAGLSLAAAAGGLYATDALTRGEVYDLPFDQVYAELSSMPLPDDVAQVSAGRAGNGVVVRREASVISWLFTTGGEEAGRFTATLSPEGPHRTRVIVDYAPGRSVREGILRIGDTAMMRKLAAAAMAEQVDSRLERRPFEQSGFMRRAAEHLQNNPEYLEEYGEAIGQSMIAMTDQIRANSEGVVAPAYEPPVGKPSPEATRPSMDLSKY